MKLILQVLATVFTVQAAIYAGSIEAEAPGTVFLESEPLRFTLKDIKAEGMRNWSVRNWRDLPVAQGEFSGEKLVVEPLPPGYYTLFVAGGARSFAIVSDPEKIPDRSESPFAMATVMAAFCKDQKMGGEVMRRSGASMVREQHYWLQDGPDAPISWSYTESTTELYSRGVSVLGMWHSAPYWTKKAGKTSESLPDDLTALYEWGRKNAVHYGKSVAAWQFWNEPDVETPAWDYAACLKAYVLGVRSVEPDKIIVNSGVAFTPLNPFSGVCFRNGTPSYFDVFAFHTYDGISTFPARVNAVRSELNSYGIRCPIWVTENGTRSLEGAAQTPSCEPGHLVHSPEQEMIMAEFLPKSQIEMLAAGASRCFYFLMFPYDSENNGTKDFGLMRRDWAVKPGYVAFAAMVRMLAGKEYLGPLTVAEGVRAHLFMAPDQTRTLVYWTKSPVDDQPACKKNIRFSLPMQPGTYLGSDLMGTPVSVTARSGRLSLEAEPFPRYLTGLPAASLPGRLMKQPKSIRLRQGDDLHVVIQARLSEDFLVNGGKSVSLKPGIVGGKLTLSVYNFSEENKQGSLNVTGATVQGLPEEIKLAPWERKDFELKVIPKFNGKAFLQDMVVIGKFNDRLSTPFVLPVYDESRMLAAARHVPLRKSELPENWRKNSSGIQEIFRDKSDDSLVFRTEFRAGIDKWVYPEYILSLPRENPKGAYGVCFELSVFPEELRSMLVMAVYGDQKEFGETYFLPVNFIRKSGWQKIVVPFGGVEPSKVRMLRLGGNVHDGIETCTYRIRNLEFIFAK